MSGVPRENGIQLSKEICVSDQIEKNDMISNHTSEKLIINEDAHTEQHYDPSEIPKCCIQALQFPLKHSISLTILEPSRCNLNSNQKLSGVKIKSKRRSLYSRFNSISENEIKQKPILQRNRRLPYFVRRNRLIQFPENHRLSKVRKKHYISIYMLAFSELL